MSNQYRSTLTFWPPVQNGNYLWPWTFYNYKLFIRDGSNYIFLEPLHEAKSKQVSKWVPTNKEFCLKKTKQKKQADVSKFSGLAVSFDPCLEIVVGLFLNLTHVQGFWGQKWDPCKGFFVKNPRIWEARPRSRVYVHHIGHGRLKASFRHSAVCLHKYFIINSYA